MSPKLAAGAPSAGAIDLSTQVSRMALAGAEQTAAVSENTTPANVQQQQPVVSTPASRIPSEDWRVTYQYLDDLVLRGNLEDQLMEAALPHVGEDLELYGPREKVKITSGKAMSFLGSNIAGPAH